MGAVYGKDGTQTIKNYKNGDKRAGEEAEGEPLSPTSLQRASSGTSNALFGERVGLPEYPAPDPGDVANVFVTTPCEVPLCVHRCL